MKFTYLGTAAAEGLPAVFCNCEYCKEARRLKGKNIRTRSQSLINDDLLIDLPADTYMHFLQNDIEADKIKYLFITHSHSDHFYYEELEMRNGAFAHNMRSENLRVFCGKGVMEKFKSLGIPKTIEVKEIAPYETIELEGYRVTALPARHMKGDGALIYIIEADKIILYAHDTGYLFDEALSFIEEKNFKFDMVSFDCTNVEIPVNDDGSHMGLPNIGRLKNKLFEIGAVSDETKLYINHFSHNGNPIHSILEEKVKGMGLNVSYDGLSIDI